MDLETILMRIAILCGWVICLLAVLIGVAVWFVSGPFILKLAVSMICIMFGAGFGSVGIDLWDM